MESYNAVTSSRERLEASSYLSFIQDVTNTMRFIADVRNFRPMLSSDKLFVNTTLSGSNYAGFSNNDSKVFALASGDLQPCLNVVESPYREDQAKAIIAGFTTPTASKSSNETRTKEGILSLMDMSVIPINFHALMRDVPAVNLYNYSYTFDQLTARMYGLTAKDVDVTPSTPGTLSGKMMFLKLLKNPYYAVDDLDYGFVNNETISNTGAAIQRIFRGDSALQMGRPKFLSDQLFNKALLNSLYIQDSKFDEAGPSRASANLTNISNALTIAKGRMTADIDRVINTLKAAIAEYVNAKDASKAKDVSETYYNTHFNSLLNVFASVYDAATRIDLTNSAATKVFEKYAKYLKDVNTYINDNKNASASEAVAGVIENKKQSLRSTYLNTQTVVQLTTKDATDAQKAVTDHAQALTDKAQKITDATNAANAALADRLKVEETNLKAQTPQYASDKAAADKAVTDAKADEAKALQAYNDYNVAEAQKDATLELNNNVGSIKGTKDAKHLIFKYLANTPLYNDPNSNVVSDANFSDPKQCKLVSRVITMELSASLLGSPMMAFPGYNYANEIDAVITTSVHKSSVAVYTSISYLHKPKNQVDSMVKEITIGTKANMQLINTISKLRFDTKIVRNLMFITNLMRILRLKLQRDLTQDRHILVSGHAMIKRNLTEFDMDEFGPNEVSTDREYIED
jgi:hypothetical protein